MQVTQDWKRKRAGHCTACWTCYRSHRACDGGRPCKRCLDLGRGATCRDPVPDERIPTKKHKPKICTLKMPKRKGFFIVKPQMLKKSKPWPAKEACCSASAPLPSTTSPFPSLAAFNSELDSPSDYRTHEAWYPEKFSGYVCQEEILSQKKPQRSILQSNELNPEDDIPEFTLLNLFPWQQTQITLADDDVSAEALMEGIFCETEEIYDHQKSPGMVFKSQRLPNDFLRLTESLFTPFGLRDATQPFMVFKPTLVDRGTVARASQHTDDLSPSIVIEFTLLTASPSFCDLIQYSEDEVLGPKCVKIFPAPVPVPDREKPVLRYLQSQASSSVHHTPIFRIQPYWFTRDGRFLHGNATMQFFYSAEGTISFIVLGLEKFAVSEDLVPPFPAPELFSHPSALNERII